MDYIDISLHHLEIGNQPQRPATATSILDNTLGESSIHVGMVGFPRVEGFIRAGLALDHARVVGARTEPWIIPEVAPAVLLLGKLNEPPWNSSD